MWLFFLTQNICTVHVDFVNVTLCMGPIFENLKIISLWTQKFGKQFMKYDLKLSKRYGFNGNWHLSTTNS
jgi:hypothetical protein